MFAIVLPIATPLKRNIGLKCIFLYNMGHEHVRKKGAKPRKTPAKPRKKSQSQISALKGVA